MNEPDSRQQMRELIRTLTWLYGDAYLRMTSPAWTADLRAWRRLNSLPEKRGS